MDELDAVGAPGTFPNFENIKSILFVEPNDDDSKPFVVLGAFYAASLTARDPYRKACVRPWLFQFLGLKFSASSLISIPESCSKFIGRLFRNDPRFSFLVCLP